MSVIGKVFSGKKTKLSPKAVNAGPKESQADYQERTRDKSIVGDRSGGGKYPTEAGKKFYSTEAPTTIVASKKFRADQVAAVKAKADAVRAKATKPVEKPKPEFDRVNGMPQKEGDFFGAKAKKKEKTETKEEGWAKPKEGEFYGAKAKKK